MTPIVLQRTPNDVFPDIDIPVISIAWNYSGLSPQQMEERIVSPFERFMTTVVDNIEHTESQTVGGRSVIKSYFQPGTDVHVALTQTSAIAQAMLRQCLPNFLSASHHLLRPTVTHPAIGLRGQCLSEQELFATEQISSGTNSLPWPVRQFHGRMAEKAPGFREPGHSRLQARALSPVDVNHMPFQLQKWSCFPAPSRLGSPNLRGDRMVHPARSQR